MAQQTTVPGPDLSESSTVVLGDAGEHMLGRLKHRIGQGWNQPSPNPDTEVSWQQRLGVVASRCGLVAAGLLLIAAFGLFAFRALYSDRIYPAIVVGDVQVGGLTADQATAKLNERAGTIETGFITFTYGGKTWTPSLSDLGSSVDVNGAVQEAKQIGRSGDAIADVNVANDLLRGNQTVPLRTSVNYQALDAWFDTVDAEIDQRAVDATIVMDGATAKISPEADGIVIDRDAATKQIVAALTSLQPISGELPTMVEHPTVRASDLQAHYDEISKALGSTFTLTFEGKQFSLPAKDLAPYVIVENASGADVRVALDVEELAGYLNERYGGEINRKPVDAVIAWGGEEVVATTDSIDGVTLKPKALAQGLSDGFLTGKPVEIPVAVSKPEIDSNNLAALGIKGLISRGDSNFAGGGGGARDTNIYVGAELANGTLVRPGADYSFNGAIGAITEDKGYVVSDVIFGDVSGKDIGGGICQISTTVFRAALMGGFPITEWNPHAFQLLNYQADGWDAGFDASILQLGDDPSTWGDFKFTNDTGGWLLVHTWTSYPNVIVEIYGPAMDRSVEIVNYWSNVQDTGALSTGFTRLVKDADGNVLYERNFDTYFLVPKAGESQ